MLIAVLHTLLNMCSFRTDGMLFHILRKTFFIRFDLTIFMVTVLLLLMVGNLKSISLSEVASDNIILIQAFIKISQLFHKLVEHNQRHTPPQTHTHTHTHAHTQSIPKVRK